MPQCESRSLLADRFADPTARDNKEDKPRKKWFKAMVGKKADLGDRQEVDDSWLRAGGFHMLHARLISRLMVNMSGGVMENAGLLLDRHGIPYIPGSAVKGCARRMALQALHHWVKSPGQHRDGEDPGTPCCEGFRSPAEMLATIAAVFGWAGQDWEQGSDFVWACGTDENGWASLSDARDLLSERISWLLGGAPPARRMSGFSGSVAFLAARPNKDPGLEIEVLTPHHGDYYCGKNPNAVATDTENPLPVFFPAVKSQNEEDYFTFPLLPLRGSDARIIGIAQRWLASGLSIFGLGAKTNAGYGVFEILPESAIKEAKAAAQITASDFASEVIFKSRVLDLLERPQAYQNLIQEVELLKKTENADWLAKLRERLASPSGKDARKRLKDKEWFPKEWLPTT